MQMRLRSMLFALVMLLGQTLAVSVASAHDIDPGHAPDECSVCITVQSIDTPPPVATITVWSPDLFHWSPEPVVQESSVSKALAGVCRARAPPR